MSLTPQQPASGILLSNEFSTEKTKESSYRISCNCGSEEHNHNLWVAHDLDCKDVTVTIYTQVTTPFWSTSRFKQIWQILTTGTTKLESSLILTQQQAVNYAAALTKFE
ncbi:hypothetical protein UFOVP116_353 [uncultured Caudovirales phage]|uniref:Uncharacterized protein n=1 Tax=uncultured Caudovirales phage TaxID=2100421 RepID=A0A6J5LB61_9CAUD|nr:hypothetical protein UFOVP116_353 [uncultured Caudovirales phage]